MLGLEFHDQIITEDRARIEPGDERRGSHQKKHFFNLHEDNPNKFQEVWYTDFRFVEKGYWYLIRRESVSSSQLILCWLRFHSSTLEEVEGVYVCFFPQ